MMKETREGKDLKGIDILQASNIFPLGNLFRPQFYYSVSPLSLPVLDIKTIMARMGLHADGRKCKSNSQAFLENEEGCM